MASIHLYVPQQTLTYSAYIDIRPRYTQAWLDALPAANLGETARMLRSALLEINKVKMPASQRHALMEQFVTVVDRLANGLRATYRDSPLPPTDEQLENINSLQQIYASIANGYKILVSEVQRSSKGMSGSNQGFMQAMCGAMEYLSLQLLQAYEVYFPEPKRVWGELHYLYLLAQRAQVLQLPIKPRSGRGPAGLSLADRYKRVVMVTLGNPYHLIQGEGPLLYEKLGAWARQITLTPWRSGDCPAGHFFVDMGTDSAPRYAPSAMQLNPIYPFVIDVGDVLEILKRLVMDLKTGEGESTTVGFSERKLRSMYERAATAWGGRQERLGVRTHGMSDTVMLMGLSHCYRLFSEVAPELDLSEGEQAEDGVQKSKPKKDSGLRLMDIEDHIRQASAQVEARRSDYDVVDFQFGETQESPQEDAVVAAAEVEIVFGNSEGDKPIMEEDTSRWRQRNQSQGGVSLFCFMDCAAPVRVGEIIAFRPSTSRWNEDWRVGAVRWLRVQPGQGLEMGVRTLADDGAAVRTKAVSGVGTGGELGRCLLVPWGDPRHYPANLITPPAIYDEGTVLALELSPEVVIPVRLDNLVDSSNRYSQFRFSYLESPPKLAHWNVMK